MLLPDKAYILQKSQNNIATANNNFFDKETHLSRIVQ